MPVPGLFLGSQFAIPHLRGNHVYDLFSPVGDAVVEITLGASTQIVNLVEGQVTSFVAGNDNSITGLVKSSHLIFVHHRATSAPGAGVRYDAYPVPPADSELWGLRSSSLYVAATENGTTATAFSDTGEVQVLNLQAGERAEITIGSNISQGGGSAIYVQSDKPVNAIVYEDGDGSETTAAWSSAFRGVYYGIPIDSQYVSIVCPDQNTEVTLTDGANPPEIQNCGGTGQFPGKAFFGSNQNGVHVSAGASIQSSQPIFLYYESSATNDEKNLLGTRDASPNPVTAQFTATPESGNAPLDVFFDGSVSSGVNTISSYTWDFGDGNNDNGVTVSHGYTQAGSYLVSLIVEDSGGATDQTTLQVTVNPPVPGQVLLSSGLVNAVTDNWQTVTLADTYTSMVVVATVVLPDQASVPAVARIRNATGNQFEIKLENPSGLPVSGYSVHYVVAEEGQYNETEHGIDMEVVKLDSTITASKGSWLRQVRSFYNTYTSPVVIGQVMSENDPNWSVFWASSDTSRNDIPNGVSLAFGKHVGEDIVSNRNDELIGYIVLEARAYTIDGTSLLAGVGADSVSGVGNSATGYSYAISNITNPEIVILSSAAMDGGDGGWPVLFGADPVSASTIQLAIDEDQIRDTERNHTSEQVAYLAISTQSNAAPAASFTADSTSGDAPLTVNADARGSGDSDGTITNYDWDFGDGNTATGAITSHQYTVAGSNTLTLTVTDDDGATDQATLPITVTLPNQAPTASFTANPTSGEAPLLVQVDGSGSIDSDGTIETYEWDFGDGFTGSGLTASHEYANAGVFTLALIVTDNEGGTAQLSTTVSVNNSEPPQPFPPSISTLSGTSTSNPFVVDGVASPNTLVRLYSNGQSVGSVLSSSNGLFDLEIPLNHGVNEVYAVSLIDGDETDPSNVISLTYNNTLAPEQGGLTINTTVVWPALPNGQSYTIHNGDVTITETGKLIILPGAKVAASFEKIVVRGKLIANGTPDEQIVFTESAAIYAFGGIYIESTAAEIEITHAVIEHANYGVHVDYTGPRELFVFENNIIRHTILSGLYIDGSSNVEIRNNHFTANNGSGITVVGGGSQTRIYDNVIDLNDKGIVIIGGVTSPEIDSNSVRDNDIGVRIFGRDKSEPNEPYGHVDGLANPVFTSNTVSENEIGFSIHYRSNPLLTNNQISDNEIGIYLNGHSSDFSVSNSVPGQDIEPPLPVISNNSFFDNVSGGRRQNIVAKNYYRGVQHTIDAMNNWWGSPNPADVADQIEHAKPGVSYKPIIDYSSFLDGPLPTGIPVIGNFIFRIDGDLTLAEDQEYVFVEQHIAVYPDDVLTVGAGTRLEFAVATPGYTFSTGRKLEVNGEMNVLGTPEKPVEISSASAQQRSWHGIELDGGLLHIDNAKIDNADYAVDARYSGSEVTVSNSEFSNNRRGVRLFTNDVTADINSSFFTGNTVGLEIGVNGAISTIQINENEIYDNAERGMNVLQYIPPSGSIIDATRNWWGNAPPIMGADIYLSSVTLEPWIDYSNYAFAPLNSTFPDDFSVQYNNLSPDGNGIQDSTAIQGCFTEVVDWVVIIRNSADIVVKSWNGLSQCFDFSWDGSDEAGSTLPNGDYNLGFYEVQADIEDAIELVEFSLNTVGPVVVPPNGIGGNASDVLTHVNIGAAQAADSSGNPLEVTADNTGPFGLGSTIVTWTAIDSHGNLASATQAINIYDNIRPSLIVPDDILAFSDVAVEVELGQATADDLFLESVANNAPSVFPLGTTVVTWTATDTSGNVTHLDQVVEISDIEIVIAAPLNGSTTNQNTVIVQGTLKGPENSGLTVNGEVAFIDRTNFPFEFSLSLPLEEGNNDMVINAQSLSGLTASNTISVIRQGAIAQTPYDVLGSNTLGVASLEVEFEITGLETGLVEFINYDWNGDDADDFTYDVPQHPAPEQVIQPYIYSTPGSFQAKVTVKEFSGTEYEYIILIQVVDPLALDSLFQSIWNNFNQALLNGDQTGAENLMTESMRDKYSDAIAVLIPQFPAIISSYTQFRPVSLNDSYAGYVLNRTINSEDRAFFVYFIKGLDGVWRLVSM
ncbi:MAG: PKD domain-containing protein [Arenicellales bacterium]